MDFPDPKYRQMCSRATLHTKDGFFGELLNKLTNDVGPEFINGPFAREELDKDKVRICCKDPKVWPMINGVLKNIDKHFRKKCAKSSLEARLQGEKAMKDGAFQKAAMLFSQSVIKAPKLKEDLSADDGLTLPLALRSRAQAFYDLNRFQDCITDLHLCLEEGYPEPLRYQLYRTMAEAYRELGETKRSQISWQVALKLIEEQILRLETSKVKGSKRTKNKDVQLKTVLEKERDLICKSFSSNTRKPISFGEMSQSETRGVLPKIESVNENYPNASSLISIERTLQQGRFAAAAGNIPTGTTLIVEEPYASVLITDKFGSHCNHCYAKLNVAVPCSRCAGLAYCSTKCRNIAITYHRYECEYLGLFQGAGLSALSYLALRMITQQGFTFFKDLQEKIEKMKDTANANLTAEEAKYVQVYNLTTHTKMRPNNDYFHRTIMAMFLVQCLRDTDFFPVQNEDVNNFFDYEILTASVILRHLQLLQFNAHELYETKTTVKGRTKGSKAVYIAVGIYPTVALFNHECAPAVTRYFNGKNIIIRTVKPLKKGEVISENYGPIFSKRTLMERTRDLTSRYWFNCICQACREQWPRVEDMNDEIRGIRCPTSTCRNTFKLPINPERQDLLQFCPSCYKKVNMTEVFTQATHYETLYDRGVQYLKDDKPEMAEPLLTVFLDKIFDKSPPPSREICAAQEALRSCFAQEGNLWLCE